MDRILTRFACKICLTGFYIRMIALHSEAKEVVDNNELTCPFCGERRLERKEDIGVTITGIK